MMNCISHLDCFWCFVFFSCWKTVIAHFLFFHDKESTWPVSPLLVWSKKSYRVRPTMAWESEQGGGVTRGGKLLVRWQVGSWYPQLVLARVNSAWHLHIYTRPRHCSSLVSHISLTLQTEMENMCSHKESKGREVYIGLCCSHSEGYIILPAFSSDSAL